MSRLATPHTWPASNPDKPHCNMVSPPPPPQQPYNTPWEATSMFRQLVSRGLSKYVLTMSLHNKSLTHMVCTLLSSTPRPSIGLCNNNAITTSGGATTPASIPENSNSVYIYRTISKRSRPRRTWICRTGRRQTVSLGLLHHLFFPLFLQVHDCTVKSI